MKLTRFNDLIESGRVRKGRWEFKRGHELVYRSEGLGEEFRFKGSLIAASPGTLAVSLTERQSDQKAVTHLVKLSGNWKADSRNRLLFEVEREGGRKDVLTFRSGWELDDRHRIIYRVEQTDLKRKRKLVRELVFDGHWDLSKRDRLVYLLGGSSESAFRFRGAFQTQSIFAKKGEIRYQLGIEASGKHKFKSLIFFGKWKVSRDLGLSFEVEGGPDKKSTFSFGGDYSLKGGKRVSAALKTADGKPLGIEVIFSKDFFGRDGQAFLKAQRSVEESRAEAGLGFKF